MTARRRPQISSDREPSSGVSPSPNASPFEPTQTGLEAFLSDKLGVGDVAGVAAALEDWARWTARPNVTVGISVSGLDESGQTFASLVPILEGGFADWIVVRAEDLFRDAEQRFHRSLASAERSGRSSLAPQMERLVERIRLRDAYFTREQLENTELFFGRLIQLAAFQDILSTAELNELFGKFLRARDEYYHIEDHSLLARAARLGTPLFSSLTDGSIIGRQIAAAALTGNRLVVDTGRDLNLAAGILLRARQNGGRSVVASLGGGPPRDLLIQSGRHLGRLLGTPGHHGAVFEIANPGRARLGPMFSAIWPEGGPELRSVELEASVALPLWVAYWIQRAEPTEPSALLGSSSVLLEQLRDAHLRHDLERQVRETGAQLQAGVKEAQDQFQSKLEEQRATIQTEVHRLQQQAQSHLNRFLKQFRPPSRAPGTETSKDAPAKTSREQKAQSEASLRPEASSNAVPRSEDSPKSTGDSADGPTS